MLSSCKEPGKGGRGGSYHLKTMSLCFQPAVVTQGRARVYTAARPAPAASPGTHTAEFSIFQSLFTVTSYSCKTRPGSIP